VKPMLYLHDSQQLRGRQSVAHKRIATQNCRRRLRLKLDPSAWAKPTQLCIGKIKKRNVPLTVNGRVLLPKRPKRQFEGFKRSSHEFNMRDRSRISKDLF